MDEILDEETSNLLKKHNIPPELIEILADDAIRLSLSAINSISEGITLYSKDDGKLFAITRCIEKIRRVNPQYAKAFDKKGAIEYADEENEKIKSRRPEQIIDLDNIDLTNERKKSVCRYTNTFLNNKYTMNDLNSQIEEMSGSYISLELINKRIQGLYEKMESYKSKVTEIEVSVIPNIFRHRKLKEYNQKVRKYMNKIDKSEKLKAEIEKNCDNADKLIIPRKKRIKLIESYNGIVGNRVGELLQKHGISQEVIKKHTLDYIGVEKIPEGIITTKEKKIPEKGVEK